MKIIDSKGNIFNTCPYLDEIKEFLENNKGGSELIENIEIVRAIATKLRETSGPDIIDEYRSIENNFCTSWKRETPYDACLRMQKEIEDLKWEISELKND